MEQINFRKDDVICYQGDPSDGLFILLDGELEVLIADEITPTMKKNEILNLSKRVGIISQKKAPFGEISFFLNAPRNATIRALKNGSLVKIPADKDAISTLLKTNPVIGLSISKTLLHKSLATFGVIEDSVKIYKQAQMYFDNFSYMYYKINQNAKNKETLVYKTGKDLFALAHTGGNKISEKLSLAIIDTNLSQVFQREYGIPIEIPNINMEIIDLVKNIFYLPDKVAKIVIKLSPNIVEFSCLKLSEYLQQLNEVYIEINKQVEEQILKLAGQKDSVFDLYFILYDALKSANHPNAKFVEKSLMRLGKIIKDLTNQYIDMYGSNIKTLHKEYLKMESKFKTEEAAVKAKKQEAKKLAMIEQSNLKFEDNFNSLLALPCSNEDIKSKLRAAMEKYHKIVDKFDTVGDTRKIKKDLDNIYWDFYKDLFIHYIDKGGQLPIEAILMLRYGVLDENTLNEETIACLKSTPIDTPHKLPIYFADEWLEKICNNEETPSINGLGQTYNEYLKENNITAVDATNEMLKYEIKEVLAAAMRTCAGMLSNQTPILDSDYISLKPENSIVTKEKLEQTVREILAVDYSCFYREVRLVYAGDSDFVQKEIEPNFIIVPVAGSRAVCWQELDGKNKMSRARIMVPLFATADLKEMLLLALAHFRWELAKTIAGPNWGDPVEGGLTGKYFDYTSTFKQSKELSEEVKEKIKKQFKKLAQTKDRFADDYILWINFESQAIFKLNVLNRDIFYNYVPFAKNIRDKVASNPNFQKLNFKFVNLNTKKLQQIDTKIKKLEKAGIEIPEDVRREYEFYKLGI